MSGKCPVLKLRNSGELYRKIIDVRGSFAFPRLVCPETRQPLTEASAAIIGRLNDAIARGTIAFAGGDRATQRLDGGFIRQDELVVYPVILGIPHLTVDQAIGLAQLEATR